MKHIQLFEQFINEQEDSKEVLAYKEKLKGQPALRAFIGMYKFYFENGFKEFKSLALLNRAEYYDQEIRSNDKLFALLNKAGVSPIKIDQMNVKLVTSFIGKLKPGTDEFSKLWLIIQHADSQPAIQQKFMKVYGKEMQKSDSKGFAMMQDRIAINNGEQQTTLSQGMRVTYNGKTGWLPWQMKGIEIEKETKTAESELGDTIQLVKPKSTELKKINKAIEQQIGEKNVAKAKKAGLPINLATYIEHVMSTDFIGNYMIKK